MKKYVLVEDPNGFINHPRWSECLPLVAIGDIKEGSYMIPEDLYSYPFKGLEYSNLIGMKCIYGDTTAVVAGLSPNACGETALILGFEDDFGWEESMLDSKDNLKIKGFLSYWYVDPDDIKISN